MDNFLGEGDKHPPFQALAEFKQRQVAMLASQRVANVPLFQLSDNLGEHGFEIATTMEEVGAVFVDPSHPNAGREAYGLGVIPKGLRPIESLTVPHAQLGRLNLDGLGLSDDLL